MYLILISGLNFSARLKFDPKKFEEDKEKVSLDIIILGYRDAQIVDTAILPPKTAT